MKKISLHVAFVWVLVLLVVASCKRDPISHDFDMQPMDSVMQSGSPTTFGIRHDKNLSDYELVGANQAPYDLSQYPDFSPVVFFNYSLDGSNDGGTLASGSLIAPDWILTAGHNFFIDTEQTTPAPASGIKVYTGADPNNPTGVYSVDTLIFHPTWRTANMQQYQNANDLCLVKLSSPITSITPAELNFESTESIGASVWYAGYGVYSEQPGQNPNLFSKRHAIENILDRVVGGLMSNSGSMNYPGGLLAFDFDSPLGDINTLGDNIVNFDEQVLGSGTSSAEVTDFEGGTVLGDSGGPLFIQVEGVWKIAGVLSGGIPFPFPGHQDSSYGDISVFMRVSSHKDWIQSVVN